MYKHLLHTVREIVYRLRFEPPREGLYNAVREAVFGILHTCGCSIRRGECDETAASVGGLPTINTYNRAGARTCPTLLIACTDGNAVWEATKAFVQSRPAYFIRINDPPG
uniref:Uncharacterized protein n=1 Tax=Lygus hesperus TaxID=30085 RepID=A0A146M480_LYGHE